jgi:hypothetical protein
MNEKGGRERRPHKILVYFTKVEYDIAIALFRKTTYRTMSEYGRKLFLNKPIRVVFRNASLDDLLEAVSGILRKDELLLAQPELMRELKSLFHQIVDQCIRASK